MISRVIQEAISDSPELMQYFVKHEEEIKQFIAKFEVKDKDEIKELVYILMIIEDIEVSNKDLWVYKTGHTLMLDEHFEKDEYLENIYLENI